jgi:enediyne biosynthesis protein E4
LKPQVGRHDASRGVLLVQGVGRSFEPSPTRGPTIGGEVRDAAIIKSGPDKCIFIARNNDKLIVFKKVK